jgi:hypothetical protein
MARWPRSGCSETGHLRPARFGNLDGFRFELSFMTDKNLKKENAVVGAIVDRALYLLTYTGTAIQYFAKYLRDFEEIVSSIKIRKAS